MDIKQLFEILSNSEKEYIYLISKEWKKNELIKTKDIEETNKKFLFKISNGKMSSRLVSALLLNFHNEIIQKEDLTYVNKKSHRNIGRVLLSELESYL